MIRRPAAALMPAGVAERPACVGEVLAATDGSALATNAVAVGAVVATRLGLRVGVLRVEDARASPPPRAADPRIGSADDLIGPDVHVDQARDLRGALGRALGHPIAWPVRIAAGPPATAIMDEAERVSASLVVVGLQHHAWLARVAQDAVALQVTRAVRRPVLAVTAALRDAPRRITAAVDFSGASLDAARLAVKLLAGRGALVLAYAPPPACYATDSGEHRVHRFGVRAAFDWVERALAAPSGVRVERAVLSGGEPRPVASRLLDYAEQDGADLLAVGSLHHRRIERMVLGSVTADAVRDGRVSVLAVPPTGGDAT